MERFDEGQIDLAFGEHRSPEAIPDDRRGHAIPEEKIEFPVFPSIDEIYCAKREIIIGIAPLKGRILSRRMLIVYNAL